MSVQALPDWTVSLLGSSQVLTGPDSFVKELIENALDANATSISVEISVNTLDVIQVRDNGHGISPADRPLLCQRYCTSKIRDYSDIVKVAGKSFGFRGEALACAVELCDAVIVTTKCAGEETACLVKLDQHRKPSFGRACHPNGTTVRLEKLFPRLPVRAQAASKPSAIIKCVEKIKHLLYAYVFARPAVRFAFKILKADSDKKNWTYVPPLEASMKDAGLGVVGKECVSQCQLFDSTSGNYKIQALLPLARADFTKVNNTGHFVSVDGRPVCSTRGTLKQIVTVFQERVKLSCHPSGSFKKPFMSMNILCPSGTYDVNVETAKDDVAFAESENVLSAVCLLLDKVYPPCTKPDENCLAFHDQLIRGTHLCNPKFDSTATGSTTGLEDGARTSSALHDSSSSWPNIYPVNENFEMMTTGGESIDDESFCRYNGDEEEESQTAKLAIQVSNPWIIAKLNSKLKPQRSPSSKPLEKLTSLNEKIDTELSLDFALPDLESSISRSFGGLPTPLHSSSPTKFNRDQGNREKPSYTWKLSEEIDSAVEDDLLTTGEGDMEMLSSQLNKPRLIERLGSRTSCDEGVLERVTQRRDANVTANSRAGRNGATRGKANRFTPRRGKSGNARRAVYKRPVSQVSEQQNVWSDYPELSTKQKKQQAETSPAKQFHHKARRNMDIRAFALPVTNAQRVYSCDSGDVHAENTNRAGSMQFTNSNVVISHNSTRESLESDEESLPPDMSLPGFLLRNQQDNGALEKSSNRQRLQNQPGELPPGHSELSGKVSSSTSKQIRRTPSLSNSSITRQSRHKPSSIFLEKIPEPVLQMWCNRIVELLVSSSLLPRLSSESMVSQLFSMVVDSLHTHVESFI